MSCLFDRIQNRLEWLFEQRLFRRVWFALPAVLALLAAYSCSRSDDGAIMRPELPAAGESQELPHQARYLAGLRFCLDPGHGGDIGAQYDAQGYKRGPSGLREAVVNARVTEKLAELLRAAGAEVIETRTHDIDVPLAQRTTMANAANVDVFLSIHHNTSTRESANFSSVWYHGDGSRNPASVDLARYISDSLIRTIRPTEPQFSGVYSDRLMYEGGFHVLREVTMPAVLLECSFLTNVAEEARLADPSYNNLEAWAIFSGLCEWAANGIPRVKLVESPSAAASGGTYVFELLDGMKESWGAGAPRIRPGSVAVKLNGEPVAWQLDGRRLTVKLEQIPAPAVLEVHFENRAKNSSITPAFVLRSE